MTRPQSEAEYLATMVPPSVLGTRMHRRTLFKGAVGAGSALLLPSALAACSSSSSGGGSGTGSGNKTVTLGSYQSDATPKKSLADMIAGYQTKSGEHGQDQHRRPQLVPGEHQQLPAGLAGRRLHLVRRLPHALLRRKGLAGDICDVWRNSAAFTDALKAASTGDDGKQYFVPSTTTRGLSSTARASWRRRATRCPRRWTSSTALAKQMQKDGLIPIAFADKDGWPAMGTFDQLNMRINGYQFHVDLMAGKEAWNGAEGQEGLRHVEVGCSPTTRPTRSGRTWQEAAQALQQKKAGMYLLGLVRRPAVHQAAEQEDLDFFTFPEIDSTIGADAIEAPIDGYMMAAKPEERGGGQGAARLPGLRRRAEHRRQGRPERHRAERRPDTSGYTALQKKSAELVGSAKTIAQFLDRDTRPDFASTVMIPALQAFIKNPDEASTDSLDSIESQKKCDLRLTS